MPLVIMNNCTYSHNSDNCDKDNYYYIKLFIIHVWTRIPKVLTPLAFQPSFDRLKLVLGKKRKPLPLLKTMRSKPVMLARSGEMFINNTVILQPWKQHDQQSIRENWLHGLITMMCLKLSQNKSTGCDEICLQVFKSLFLRNFSYHSILLQTNLMFK